MRRRTIIGGLPWLLAAAPWRGALAAGPMRIGQLLASVSGTVGGAALEVERGLISLGLAPGQAFTFQTRVTMPDPQAMRDAIQALLPDIDLLVVWATIGGVAAKAVAPPIPVVFLSVGAPVEIGLVASLSHPGGNMTGITFEAATDTYAKRLQLLKEIVPKLSRVGVLGARGDSNLPFALKTLNDQAPLSRVQIIAVEFSSSLDLDAAFRELQRQDAEALIVVAGALTSNLRKPIVDMALTARLPSCHGFREAVEAGGLISLGPDLSAIARQGARIVAKIIAGAKPADIPVEQPND